MYNRRHITYESVTHYTRNMPFIDPMCRLLNDVSLSRFGECDDVGTPWAEPHVDWEYSDYEVEKSRRRCMSATHLVDVKRTVSRALQIHMG